MKFTILLLLLFVFGFNNSFAQKQTKTAYEKKVSEITTKYFKKIVQVKLAGGGERDVMVLKNKMEMELMMAKKLKTKVDFQREEQERIEEEKLEKQEKYENSDFRIILKGVKSSFATWNQKGEFEKKEDYYKRLKNKSKEKFDEICINEIANKIYVYLEPPGFIDQFIGMKIGTYNSEKELFPISFRVNEHIWKTTVNVPIDKAKNFKQSCDFSFNGLGIINNELFPTVISLEYEGKIYKKLPVSLKRLTNIKIPFDKLDIDNEFLKGYVFTFDKELYLKRR